MDHTESLAYWGSGRCRTNVINHATERHILLGAVSCSQATETLRTNKEIQQRCPLCISFYLATIYQQGTSLCCENPVAYTNLSSNIEFFQDVGPSYFHGDQSAQQVSHVYLGLFSDDLGNDRYRYFQSLRPGTETTEGTESTESTEGTEGTELKTSWSGRLGYFHFSGLSVLFHFWKHRLTDFSLPL